MDTTSHGQRPRRRWWRWLAIAPVVLLALLVLAHAFWGWYEERELAREVAELRKNGEPMAAEDFTTPPIPDYDNAAIPLRQAGKAIKQTSEAWARFDSRPLMPPLSPQDAKLLEEVVGQNRQSLLLLRAARARKGVNWQIQYARPMLGTLLPELGEQKALGELALGAALLAHQRGDDAEALERIRDLLMQTRALNCMRAGAVPQLVAHLNATQAASLLLQIIPHLSVGSANRHQVNQLIAELLDESSVVSCARDALKFERALCVELVGFNEAIYLARPGGLTSQQRKTAGVLHYVLRPTLASDGRFLLRYVRANLEALEASSDWPAYHRAAAVPRAMSGQMAQQPKWHILGKVLIATYDNMVLKQYNSLSTRRLAATALAVKLYAAEHEGRWPAGLDQLVPAYLMQVPADPMAGGAKRISYSSIDRRVKLWSLGEDGEDGKDDLVVELK